MDKAFFNMKANKQIEPRFLNAGSGSFDEWPLEIVYGTVYQSVAAIYGGQTLIYKNSRALDRHYWEYKNTGKAFESSVAWDSGEFVTAGYIPPSDIEGFWVREHDTSYNDTAHGNTDPARDAYTNGVKWAFQKITKDDATYVLVLDAKGARCIENGGDDHFYFCKRNFGKITPQMKSGIHPFPTVEKEKEIALAGIIAVCKPKVKCKRPDELFDAYPKTTTVIPSYYRRQIETIDMNHGAAVLFGWESKEPLAVSNKAK